MLLIDIIQKISITMLVFIPMEFLLPRFRGKKIFRKKWSLDTCYMFLSGMIVIVGMTALIALGMVLIDPLLPAGFKEAINSQPLFLQVLGVIIIADLGYYLIHRLFHASPALWRLHAIHHSIEEMDWLAAHRVHPLDQILTKGGSLVLPYAFGFSTEALSIFLIISGWNSYLIHSNINLRYGRLRWLWVSPTFHHWHHANQDQAFDKNFAGQLPIYDILFGTAIMEERKGPARYGTDTEVPSSFIGQLCLPALLLARRIKKRFSPGAATMATAADPPSGH